MRVIVIPAEAIKATRNGSPHIPGAYVVVPVKVDWPELRLTESQIIENAVALANGQPEPHDDNSVFLVQLPRSD
jgi:hypothetical protein